jgi:predicted RNase H-like HicB family nuclease
MRRYIALIETSRDHTIAATLPDFPAISCAAASLRDLRDALADNLAASVEDLERNGQTLPEPSSFETLMASHADHAAMLIAPKRKKVAVPAQGNRGEPLHARSNDEWPEADA